MTEDCVFCGDPEWVVLCGKPICEDCSDTFLDLMKNIVDAQKIDNMFEKFAEEEL